MNPVFYLQSMMELPDFGPVYTETNLSQFPVEPFNAFSNLLFLLVAIYWYQRKVGSKEKGFRFFLNVNLPLLLIGFVGGTVYHATRSHFLWMMMDVIPIYVIALFTAIYHWYLISIRGFRLILVFLLTFGLPEFIVWKVFSEHPQRYTFGYAVLAIPIILPIFWDQLKQRWKQCFFLIAPVSFLIMALCCRALDSSEFVQRNLSIGTHWLWHIFGALTCHFVLVYMEKRSLENRKV